MADIGIDDTQQLRDYSSYMGGTVVDDMETVEQYAIAEGCNKGGFTGVLELLKPTMDLLETAVTELADLAADRLSSTASGLNATADEYDRIEQGNENTLDDLY